MMNNEINDISYIKDKLKCGGYKLTEQRLQIIMVIYENNRHMSADEIYKKVKSNNVGLCTVYRNLTILEEVGVLKKVNATNISYYELEAVGEYKFHLHMKCIKCNKIIDVNEEKIIKNFDNSLEELKEKYKIEIKSTSVVLSGICEDCKRKLNKH